MSNPTAMLDLWAEEQRDPAARQAASMPAGTPDELIAALSAGLESAGVKYALTGAAAAGYALASDAAAAGAVVPLRPAPSPQRPQP